MFPGNNLYIGKECTPLGMFGEDFVTQSMYNNNSNSNYTLNTFAYIPGSLYIQAQFTA